MAKWAPPRLKKSTPLAVVALVILLCLAYTQPQTLHQRYPAIQLADCDQIRILASEEVGPDQRAEYDVTVVPGDPAFDQLMELLNDRNFSRSLRTLFPVGTNRHMTQPGDFQWELIFDYEESVPMPDGSAGSGALLTVRNFYGQLSVSGYANGGAVWQANTMGQKQWLEDIMAAIRSA